MTSVVIGKEKFAATLVVGDGGDCVTIQEAINLLPAGGGTIAVRPGTYNITAPILLPGDRDVRIIGMGAGAAVTKIDLGVNAISAFVIPNGTAGRHEIGNLSIVGGGLASQIAFENLCASTYLTLTDIYLDNVEIACLASAYLTVRALRGHWILANLATARTWKGTGIFEMLALSCVSVRTGPATFTVGGAFEGAFDLFATDSTIGIGIDSSIGSNYTTIKGCHILYNGTRILTCNSTSTHWNGCRFNEYPSGTLSIIFAQAEAYFTDCTGWLVTITLQGARSKVCNSHVYKIVMTNVTINHVMGCELIEDNDCGIEIVGGGSHTITGNYLGNHTDAGIKLTNTNGNVIVGNYFTEFGKPEILESGTSDYNTLSGNYAILNPTIIGAHTALNGVNVQTVATTPVALNGTYDVVEADTTAGNRTYNLPAAATCRYKAFTISKKTADAFTVIIVPNGAELISGQPSITLMSQYECVKIISNGTGWVIVSQV